jgi:hypothetical protein
MVRKRLETRQRLQDEADAAKQARLRILKSRQTESERARVVSSGAGIACTLS